MKSQKASLGFIFVTILIDVIGVGIIIPVIPKLIENLTGLGTADSAIYGGWLLFAYAAMQFVFAPFVGELSDRFGRRPILFIALFGLGVDYIFHAFAPSIGWLFVGRIIAGVFGASFTVAQAYIADISTKENKAKNFGLVGAAFGVGFIVGPLIGGVFGEMGVEIPFLIAAGLSLANLIYGFLVLPESLPKEKRRKFNWKKANPIGSLTMLASYKGMGGLVLAFFLASFAGQTMPSIWTFFTEYQYGWGPSGIGWSLVAVGFLVALVQGVLLGIFIKAMGTKIVIITGFILWSLGMGLFGFASTELMLYAFMLPFVLGGVASPTLQGLISNQVPEDEQGILQGSLTSLISLCAVGSPLLMTQTFHYFTDPETSAPFIFPGAPFILSAFLLVIGTIVVIYSLRKVESEPTENTDQHGNEIQSPGEIRT